MDDDPDLIGTTWMGKPVYAPERLLQENRNNILILVGSIIYHTEIEFRLRDMGFEEDKHYKWAIGFCGDAECPRLWRHTEWRNKERNAKNLAAIETGDEALARLRFVSSLIDFSAIDTVLDICAANGRIKEFVPENVRYIPADYMQYSEETVFCDLTKKVFPAFSAGAREKTCVLLIGGIQYTDDWRWLLKCIADCCDTFVCTHNDFVRVNRDYRREHWNNNCVVFNHQIILEMQKLGFVMTEAYDWHLRDVVMKFERRTDNL